ncbi:cyclase family protein [bacterium]|nr:cyclase family protein [bacterium]
MSYNIRDWFDTERYCLMGFDLVDLSESIEEHNEVPGEKGYSDPSVVFEMNKFETHPWVTLAIKPYYISKIVMGAHVGTHIDAPMHAVENGLSVDQISNEYIGKAVIIDVNDQLTDDELSTLLKKVDSKSIVVIRGKRDYKISEKYRKAIIRANPRVVVFGDCVNVDGVEDTICYLENNIPMIMGANQEGLESLSQGDIIFALPLKFKGIEAAPVRLFAIKLSLKEKEQSDDLSIFSMEG